MNVEVRYFSRGGNTKKLADAIAETVGTEAKTVDVPLAEGAELLILGASLYAGNVDESVIKFMDSLSRETVSRVAVFSTSAAKKSAYPLIKKHLEKKGIAVDEKEFYCKGQFLLAHRGRPNAEDLNAARKFAAELL